MAETETSTVWHPIETAPRDGTIVLLYSPARGDTPRDHYGPGQFDACDPVMCCQGRWEHELFGDPTHWMPLPELPR
jgi:hypothetical protein